METWMLVGGLVLCLAGTASAQVTGLSVLDFGAAGDGVADDTGAFQAALDQAGAKGETVLAPAGQYRLNGTLTIPAGVTLQGVWPGPHTSQLSLGTTLLAYAGRDDESSPAFIGLHVGSTLKGITIYYPEQRIEDVRPYPWTIQGQGQHFNVMDVTIVNAYNGVDCGTHHNEGHHLRNVFLCALRRGVLIDQCSDVGRVENVHIHSVYWWRANPPGTPIREQASFLTGEQVEALNRYTQENLEGFIIGRTDWEFVQGCFVIWARVGFHFVRTDTPAGGVSNVVITQSGSDIGPLAVQVDEVQSHAGIAFENCQFMSGFAIGPQNQGPVKLTGCGFWGQPAGGSQMVLNGGGTVMLNACHFNEWGEGKPCIDANAGSLLVTGSDFMGPGTQIRLGPDLTSAAIFANRLRGGERITNDSAGRVEIMGNVE